MIYCRWDSNSQIYVAQTYASTKFGYDSIKLQRMDLNHRSQAYEACGNSGLPYSATLYSTTLWNHYKLPKTRSKQLCALSGTRTQNLAFVELCDIQFHQKSKRIREPLSIHESNVLDTDFVPWPSRIVESNDLEARWRRVLHSRSLAIHKVSFIIPCSFLPLFIFSLGVEPKSFPSDGNMISISLWE